MCIIWLLLFFSGHRKYRNIIENDVSRKMFFHSMFFIGFSAMHVLKISIKSSRFSEKRKYAAELYGEEYAEFYTYLNTGAQLTYFLTLFPVSLLTGAAAGNETLAFLGAAVSVLMLFVLDGETKKKAKEKRERVLCELPDMISRLTLLVSAGMVLREAWKTISESSDSELCLEMRRTVSEMHNGIPQTEAFERFADRCRTREIRKFISALNQNLNKGSSELVMSLQQMSREQWEEKKNTVKKQGSAVEQKLLLPMMMIFAAIILMIIVPVFTNMF